MASVLISCLGLGAVRAKEDQPGPLRVGVAVADITPESPAWLRGFGARKKPSEGVARPILAQCVVFDNGQTRVALMALDLCAASYGQLLKLRRPPRRSASPSST